MKTFKKTSLIVMSVLLFVVWGCSHGSMKNEEDTSGSDQSSMNKGENTATATEDIGPAASSVYVQNHAKVQKPFELLGGPINVEISQSEGGVHVALPDNRQLDPVIFGTPDHPRKLAGTPLITGVPAKMRDSENGHYTKVNVKEPFGDKYMTMKNGKLKINAKDITATDAATTKDEVHMDASWQDDDGNTYEVNCCTMMASHGIDYPSFGGVATNIILHGYSGNGTPLMPSEYTYFAFWGIGKVSMNGKVLDQPRLIHGMLTEYVRKDGYKLAFDKDVTPEKRHFHLITVPATPDMKNFSFKDNPVHTGYMLNGNTELPFWHVMFSNLQISATRGE